MFLIPELLVLPLAILAVALVTLLVTSYAYKLRQLARLMKEASWKASLKRLVDKPLMDDVITGGVVAFSAYEQLPTTAELVVEAVADLPDGAEAALAAAIEGGVVEGIGESILDGLLIGALYRFVRRSDRITRGDLDVGTAIQDIVTDTVLATGGATFGSITAAALAVFFSVPTGGASLIALGGGAAGAAAGGGVSRWWKFRHYRKAIEAVKSAKAGHNYSLSSFARAYVEEQDAVLKKLQSVHRARLGKIREMIRKSDASFWRRTFFPEDDTMRMLAARKEAKSIYRTSVLPHLERLKKEVHRYLEVDGPRAGMLLYGQGEAVLASVPRLIRARNSIDQAWTNVHEKIRVAEAEADKLQARL